jgi:signal transduction histidine kinase
MKGLLEAATLVHDEHDVSLALERVAAVVAEALGFQTVVINLYRRAWDDFIVSTVYGEDIISDSLLGSTYEHSWWEPLLVDRFDCQGTFLIPAGSFDWSAHGSAVRFVPPARATLDEGAWHHEDELFVPFSATNGELLGIFCVGEPLSGRRPSPEELELLAAVVGYAGIAVEAAQRAVAASRQRRSLEHLLRVSSRLGDTSSAESLLGLVADAIQDALGFQKVSVNLTDAEGLLVPRAFTGWDAGEATVQASTPLAAFERLFDPAFEIEGCFLVPSDEGRSRVAEANHTYRSEMNGRGPHAWSNHWLCVPLHSRGGRVIGVIWADDPDDRLLPTREMLQALRMFANQATSAIESANDFAALHEISTTRARLLEQEREQVVHLQQLDALKDEFVALVSHELRTPLTSIQGYTEILLEDTLVEEQRGFLNVIGRNSNRLMCLVDDLLLIAEIEGGKLALELSELRIDELVDDAAATARPLAAEKGIDLQIDVTADLQILGDRSRLGQVLDNLVSNAIKFTATGGTVRLSASNEAGRAVVEVTDSGIGIPLAEQAQMFGRFFRSSSARAAEIPGTGLGLAITRGIVESHGGAIGFESEEGVGTTFRVSLPLVTG